VIYVDDSGNPLETAISVRGADSNWDARLKK
jgi:hypothetical protein